MTTALIGCGYWGSKLAAALSKEKMSFSVFDVDDQKAFEIWEKYKIVCDGRHKSLEHVLGSKSITSCIIATPMQTHYALAKACLEAGKHILVEKPLTMNYQQAVELAMLAKKKGLCLWCDETFLYDDRVYDIIRQLDYISPHVSFSFEAIWSGNIRKPKDSVVWTLGPHPVSIMIRAFRRPPLSVSFENGEYVFLYGKQDVRIRLSSTGEKKRYFRVVAKNGKDYEFDEAKTVVKSKKEPLRLLLKEFSVACKNRGISSGPVYAVRVLEEMEHARTTS